MPDSRHFIIRHGVVVADDWSRVEPGIAADAATGKIIVPLADYLSGVDAGGTASLPNLGVWLAPTDEPTVLEPYLANLPIVAIQFPKFVDGRGYSIAYLLRKRLGYQGELRAFGDLGQDQLLPLQRVGFDSFDLRPGSDLDAALAGCNSFPEVYQTSTDQPLPLFRRRAA